MSKFTTIQITKETKEKLDSLKLSHRETYNTVINNLIEDTMELSEQTKKDISEALEDVKAGRMYTQEEVERMVGFL